MKWYDSYGRLLMVIAIIAAAAIFAGCVEDEKPVPTPTPIPSPEPTQAVTLEAPTATLTTAPAETPEPTATLAPSPTSVTVTPAPTTETSPTVYISGLHLNEEWVKITNSGTSPVTMTEWKIADDDAKHTYIFPSFTLSPEATVTLHTGDGGDTDTELYWGGKYVWNNDGDTARLYGAGGDLIDALKK